MAYFVETPMGHKFLSDFMAVCIHTDSLDFLCDGKMCNKKIVHSMAK